MPIQSHRTFMSIIAAAGAAALLSACQSSGSADAEMETEMTAPEMAMVTVADQVATDSITVASVDMPVDGFVVIHATDENGDIVAPDSIGHLYLEAGSHTDVVVPLEFPVASGDTVIAMLHGDSGELGVYEFRTGATENDLPLMENDAPVVKPLAVQ